MSNPQQPPGFDVAGPLPRGVTVLEASAGTGKTYAIAALAARYVAEGIPLERVLLVTFTRMATSELRERVRERLLSVEHGLGRALAGIQPLTDPVVELLAAGPEDSVRARRLRLRRALSDFDAATIATTHGFCQDVLGGLGIAADLEPEVQFLEDLSDLVDEVLDDLYLRRFQREDRPPISRAQALAIARIAVANPAAELVPADGEVANMRRGLAQAVRAELEARKRRLMVMTYDDLLMRLDGVLGASGGDGVAARLVAGFDVVLVDEFQDTDPVQWRIMRRAFGDTGGTLVLIADPKQAIYAFRGADVYAYLEAAQQAVARATLTINWRSDRPLLAAYDALFGNAKLGEEGISYRQVEAAPAGQASRLRGTPDPAPLRIRVVAREDAGMTPGGFARTAGAREHIAKDLAADVVRLLSSSAQVACSGPEAASDYEEVRPRHLAVLVRTNSQAALIRRALEEARVPAVTGGTGSVFAAAVAHDWLRLLEALERPTSITRAHAAALTPFVGWSAEQVAGAGESEWESLHRRLHDWTRVLRLAGVASLLETIVRSERLTQRVLAHADGERQLTDVRHIAQLLHAAASNDQLGTTALTAWLRRRMLEAVRETSDEDRSRRLESDAEAVQVLTIHRSKGLEFPIVYVPFLWDPGFQRDELKPVCFHDPQAGSQRMLDVTLSGSSFREHRQQSLGEQRGEDLRLLYVALTRARHQAVLWWAGSRDGRHAPLTRLVFERRADGTVPAQGRLTPTDAVAMERLRSLAAEAPGAISVERSRLGMPISWSPPLRQPAGLGAAMFARELDRRWRRTSYSDMTADTHDGTVPEDPFDQRVASEPEEPVLTDEPNEPRLAPTGPPQQGDIEPAPPRSDPTPGSWPTTPVPLGQMPTGTAVGTLVHQVLEATDFAADDLGGELSARLAEAQRSGGVDVGDPEAVVAGLRAAIETPLGPLLNGLRLRDLGRADRLDELEFELPLAGGDQPRGAFAPAAFAEALREHLRPGDPMIAYAERLRDPSLGHSARGYLTGFLDLVVRVPGPDGRRFAVVDYKTNWLGAPAEPLIAWHYRPQALLAEMGLRHYGLQALLYVVALHRYLRWRVPDYDPDRHLAGVIYAFLRGMTGSPAPVFDDPPCGVFAWRPPGALVAALSDALDRGFAG